MEPNLVYCSNPIYLPLGHIKYHCGFNPFSTEVNPSIIPATEIWAVMTAERQKKIAV